MSILPAKRLNSVKEYYFSKKLREVAQLQKSGKEIINMAIGSPDLAPPKEVLSAIESALHLPGMHKYQSYQGLPELRSAIAGFYQTNYGVILNLDTEVLPLMGSKEGIMHISMAFLNSGDQVLIPNPGYPTYASVTKLLQADPIYYELCETSQWQPDFEALEAMDLSKVKLMWVNYPHMPTGAKAKKSTFEKAIAFAKKHDILLINDNPYSFILNSEPLSILSIDGAKEVALELNSLSKTFNMAGWRVGMLQGAQKYISEVLKVKSNMDSGMFKGLQIGAIAALQLGKEWYDKMDIIYVERRLLIWQLADILGCTYEKEAVSGMFVWAKLPSDLRSAEELVDDLLYNHNIFITPGSIFGSAGSRYIRFSLCVNKEAIEKAIAVLKAAKSV